MSWISKFARNSPKSRDYAERTLAAYRLGIKAGGAIRGIRILTGEGTCDTCLSHANAIYSPDDAPKLPHQDCTHSEGCRCAYTLEMDIDGKTVDWSLVHRSRE